MYFNVKKGMLYAISFADQKVPFQMGFTNYWWLTILSFQILHFTLADTDFFLREADAGYGFFEVIGAAEDVYFEAKVVEGNRRIEIIVQANGIFFSGDNHFDSISFGLIADGSQFFLEEPVVIEEAMPHFEFSAEVE